MQDMASNLFVARGCALCAVIHASVMGTMEGPKTLPLAPAKSVAAELL